MNKRGRQSSSSSYSQEQNQRNLPLGGGGEGEEPCGQDVGAVSQHDAAEKSTRATTSATERKFW